MKAVGAPPRSNWALKLVSLLLAVMMWARISGKFVEEDDSVTRVFYPVLLEPQNRSEDMRLSMENYLFSVTLKGSDTALSEIDPNGIQVLLDLEGYSAGIYNTFLSPEFVRLPPIESNVSVENIFPRTVKFTLVQQTVKTVTIVAYTEGEPGENYEVKDTVLMPAESEIVGPTKNLEGVSLIIAENIDIAGATENLYGVLRFDYDKAMPKDTVFTRNATDFRYMVVIEEKIRELEPERDYPIVWEDVAGSTLELATAKLRVSGPISAVEWFNPDWVEPLARPPVANDAGAPSPENPAPQEEPNREQAAAENPPPAKPAAVLTTRWRLPPDALADFPDWQERAARLTLTWVPDRVEVNQP